MMLVNVISVICFDLYSIDSSLGYGNSFLFLACARDFRFSRCCLFAEFPPKLRKGFFIIFYRVVVEHKIICLIFFFIQNLITKNRTLFFITTDLLIVLRTKTHQKLSIFIIIGFFLDSHCLFDNLTFIFTGNLIEMWVTTTVL